MGKFFVSRAQLNCDDFDEFDELVETTSERMQSRKGELPKRKSDRDDRSNGWVRSEKESRQYD